MKKIVLIFALMLLISINGNSQQVKNLQINEIVHFQDVTLDSCYIVITEVIAHVNQLTATYQYSTYKSKAIYQSNPQWIINVNEITITNVSFTADFLQGDLFEKCTNEFKLALLRENPLWCSENLIIEK